ncbi:MAG: hypothetical protein ING44_13595 [Telmatospirillum sp.]|nr:hypothetical protein [Telmatospirillum sp.]
MNREQEVRLQEGLREADGNVGLASQIERLIAAIDVCRACQSRAQGRRCAGCTLNATGEAA